MSSSQSEHDSDIPKFAEVLDQTPEQEQWPLIRGWLHKYPQPFNRFLRQKHRVYSTPDCELISHYDDVVAALGLPEIFSVQLYKPKMGSYLMTEDNTPVHNEDKEIMHALLKQEDLSLTRERVADICEQLLSNKQNMDLVAEYTRHVPAMMVQKVFGLDGPSPEALIRYSYWNQYSAFRNQHFHVAGDSKKIEKSKLYSNIRAAFFIGSVVLRKLWKIKTGKPDDDTVTRLLQQEFPRHGGLEIYRKALNAGGLLIGAVETTSEAVVHVMDELRKRPEILALAKSYAQQSDDVDVFDRLVWECLRQRPIAPYIFRKMASDFTMEHADGTQTQFKKGQTVLCLISSAMFDESAFPNPDAFDISREFGKSFHFGFGHHTCLGIAFGKILIPEMVRQLCKKPNIDSIGEFQYRGLPFPESMSISWSGATR